MYHMHAYLLLVAASQAINVEEIVTITVYKSPHYSVLLASVGRQIRAAFVVPRYETRLVHSPTQKLFTSMRIRVYDDLRKAEIAGKHPKKNRAPKARWTGPP